MVKVVEQIVLLPSCSSTSEEEYSKKQSKKNRCQVIPFVTFLNNLIGGHRTPSFEKDI